MHFEYDYLFKILFLGDSNVGKTSIVNSYCNNDFSDSNTIGVDFNSKITEINNKLIKFNIWDTSGDDKFRNIVKCYYKGTRGIILVFDITNYDSFENLYNWMNDINENSDNFFIPIVLVGNKCDLIKKRQVPYDEIIEFCNNLDINYIEVSAKEKINLENIFVHINNEIRENIRIFGIEYLDINKDNKENFLNKNRNWCFCSDNECSIL